MAMAEANWSELPTELLNLISKQINNDFDLIRFRSVCSNWRNSSISKHHPHSLPFKLQHFMPKSPPCSLSKHILLLIKPPPPQNQDQETLQPWLIRISKHSHGGIQLFHPLRPHNSIFPYSFSYVLDYNNLSVVHLGNHFVMCNNGEDPIIHQYNRERLLLKFRGQIPFDITHGYGKKFVVTCHGQKPIAVGALNYKGHPVLFNCLKERWTLIPCRPTFFQDICVFKERFCAVNKTGRTVAFGLDYSDRLVAEYVEDGGDMKFLVESEGELLLVDIYDRHCFRFPGEDGLRLNVFKLDEKEKRWVKLTNLGDRVLFLGNGCSFSASIPKGGNCVIFIDEAFHPVNYVHFGMCVFHLDNGRLSPLSDYPHYLNLFWPPPDWIVKYTSEADHESVAAMQAEAEASRRRRPLPDYDEDEFEDGSEDNEEN